MSGNYGEALQKLLGVDLGDIAILVGEEGEELTHEMANKMMMDLREMMSAAGKEGSYYDGRKAEDILPDNPPERDDSNQFNPMQGDLDDSSGADSVADLFKNLLESFNLLGLWMDAIDLQGTLLELLDNGLEKILDADNIKNNIVDALPDLKEEIKSLNPDYIKAVFEANISGFPMDISQPVDIPDSMDMDSAISTLKKHVPESFQNILNEDASKMMKWLWKLLDEHVLN